MVAFSINSYGFSSKHPCIRFQVSSHSHTREVEKDQLAQLEEKISLQKQQEDSIRALTERLVTASSFAREQELRVCSKGYVCLVPEKFVDFTASFLANFTLVLE